jgi:hypothetical protein
MIKQALCDVAKRPDAKNPDVEFDCRYSKSRGRRELLYDLVWTHKHADQDTFSDVILLCEIELSRSSREITKDFEKLLLGKSPLKLLVYNLPDPGRGFLQGMLERIYRFRNTEVGEIYIFVNLFGQADKNDGAYSYLVVRAIPADNPILLRFEPITLRPVRAPLVTWFLDE